MMASPQQGKSLVQVERDTSNGVIDYHMLPCKISCYLLFSGIGCITRFSNIFLVSIGLTATEAGFISGSCFAISAVAGPCWGLLADKTGYRKLIFLALSIGLATSGFSWPWIAREFQLPSNQEATVVLGNRSALWNETETRRHVPEGCRLMNTSSGNRSDYKIDCQFNVVPFSNRLFYAMFCISVLTYLCLYPTESFLNSIISNIIKNSGTNQGYGRQRMFGAIGIGSANFIAGFAADNFEHPSLSKYTAVYSIVFLPFVVLLIPLSFVLFRRTSWESSPEPQSSALRGVSNDKNKDSESLIGNNERPKPNDTSTMRVLLNIFLNMDNIFIMLTVLIVGMIRTITLSFLYLIIRDEMNGSRTSMGLSMLVNSLSSAVMFFFTKSLIKKMGGPIPCVELSLAPWIVRLILNSYIKNSWVMCLPQVLQCFGFALFWSAMVQYVEDISTKEVYITLFAILSAIQYGGGGFLGNMVGGAVYNNYKGPLLCRYTALVATVWLVLFVLYFHGVGFFRKVFGKKTEIQSQELGSIAV